MPRKKQLLTTFIAGELAPELNYRVDTKQYANGAKSLLNRRCLIGGGTARRPGSRRLVTNVLASIPNARMIEFVFNEDDQRILVFSHLTMAAFFPDGTASGFVNGPWQDSQIADMDFMQSANTIIVTHTQFPPQVITRVAPTTWTVAALQFFANGPRLEQPYFKIAPVAMTLQPSADTGAVTVVANMGWWTAAHIGQRVRYLGREMVITNVLDGGTFTANVLETLPGTYNLAVEDSTGFVGGDTVLGADSGAKGVITQTNPSGGLQLYLRQASITSTSGPGGATSAGGFNAGLFVGFPGVSNETLGFGGGAAQPSLQPFKVGEVLVGPTFSSKITAVSKSGEMAAVRDWDEALFSPVNGFPSCVALHRNRLVFAGVPSAPNLLVASRLGNIFSYNVGDGSDADAIVATIGDAAASIIQQIFSSDQLLIGTDAGLYYCPESPTYPFTPTRISFIKFGSPWPISPRCKMRAFDDGVIAVSGSIVIKARATGDTQKSWLAQEVSLLSSHLINVPHDMAVTTNFEGGPERYCAFNNSDGTITAMMLVEGQEIRNFTPWIPANGAYLSVCVVKRRLYAATTRFDQPGIQLEIFDNAVTLDSARQINSTEELANIPFLYPNATINVVTFSGFSLGTWPLHLDEIPPGPYWVGYFYNSVIETLPVVLEPQEGSNAGELMRIGEVLVFAEKSARFGANSTASKANTVELQAYRISEDANLPPPQRSGPQRFKFLGWKREPTLRITQPDPLPLTVLAVKKEVHW